MLLTTMGWIFTVYIFDSGCGAESSRLEFSRQPMGTGSASRSLECPFLGNDKTTNTQILTGNAL